MKVAPRRARPWRSSRIWYNELQKETKLLASLYNAITATHTSVMVKRKRARDDHGHNMQMGVGATVAALKAATDVDAVSPTTTTVDSDSWETVEGRKKRKKHPKGGNYPSIAHSSHARLQSCVKLSDLQNLVLYLLADGNAPQWCAVRHHSNVRKVVVLLVPGLESGMFDGTILSHSVEEEIKDGSATAHSTEPASNEENEKFQAVPQSSTSSNYRSPDDYYPTRLSHAHLPESLKPLADIFEHIWPVKTPGEDRNSRMYSPLAALLTSPIVKTKDEKKVKGPQFPLEGKAWQNKRTPVSQLIATTDELAEEGYVLHPAHYSGTVTAQRAAERRVEEKTSLADGWVDIVDIQDLRAGEVPDKDIESGAVTAGRQVLAMDCEMCITSPTGVSPQIFSLTRISIINWDGEVVLDELVKPADPITDYLTPYSGITPELLQDVTITLLDIQAKLRSILTAQTILVGHSLSSDFNALKITHPFVIDTALLYPHPRGPPLKSSLKWLSQKYLSREIQKGHGSTGHNSIEDARACLDLVKQKCEKGKAWGTPEANGESIFKRLDRSIRAKRDKVNPVGDDEHRIGAVVDWGEPNRGYGSSAKVVIGCESDTDVVASVKRAVLGEAEESPTTVPRGGCDFTWARLRELEAYRRFWNRSKTTDNAAIRDSAFSSTTKATLASVVGQTVQHIQEIWDALPSCTALIVYSGSGDPRELSEMQDMQRQYKEEFKVKKWDELSVKWTDVEEQKLRKACEKARMGCGFIAVK
nr:putative exonuclease [Quercus suber]